MNKIALSKLRTFKVGNIKRLLPAVVTVDTEDVFVISNAEDVIVVSDLHPRVRNQLRAQEKKARAGMPKEVKITSYDDLEDIEE